MLAEFTTWGHKRRRVLEYFLNKLDRQWLRRSDPETSPTSKKEIGHTERQPTASKMEIL